MAEGTGSRQDAVRRHNLSTLLGHVHRDGARSRADLTTLMGLNRSTVSTLVGDLAGRGLVRETLPLANLAPGRPSPLVHPSSEVVAVLAAQVAVDFTLVAVVGLGGRIESRVQLSRPAGRRSPQDVVADVVSLVGRLWERAPSRPRLAGVGVAVAGLVRQSDGLVHLAPNLGWRDVPLAALLDSALGLNVPVAVGNDGDLAALAEHMRGAGAGVDDLVVLTGEVGVGGGVIAAGRPLTGAAGYSGEVGHMQVNPRGRDCRCGSRGCWETEIGEDAVLVRTGRRAGGGREAVADLLAAAAAGDARTLAGLAETATWIGLGVSSLVNIFNPSRVVMGGLLAELHPYVVAEVREQVQRGALWPAAALVQVLPAALGADSVLVGAGELALAPLLADPTRVPLARAGRLRTVASR